MVFVLFCFVFFFVFFFHFLFVLFFCLFLFFFCVCVCVWGGGGVAFICPQERVRNCSRQIKMSSEDFYTIASHNFALCMARKCKFSRSSSIELPHDLSIISNLFFPSPSLVCFNFNLEDLSRPLEPPQRQH